MKTRDWKALLACCLLGLTLGSCSRSESSQEEVTLRDGRKWSVQKRVTRGPDEWFRSGRGPVSAMSLAFQLNGQRVTWTRESAGSDYSRPVVLDSVAQAPVLVLALDGFRACQEFGFPAQNIVAFRYAGGEWSRMPIDQLPEDLSVNLHSGSSEGERLTLRDLSLRAQGGSEACIKMRPWQPDPAREVWRNRIVEAEGGAQTIEATLVEAAGAPEQISPEALASVVRSAGRLGPSCEGVVTKIEPLRQWSANGTMQVVGHRIGLVAGKAVDLPGVRHAMQGAVCGDDTIHVIRRLHAELLVVYRFTKEGELKDVINVRMREAARPGPWLGLQEAQWAEDGRLVLVLGDRVKATISGRQVYRVTLP